ncbi:hypothetical protein MMC14_004100 [Varicellaria rhodocarpa]|nr:hypothetical protein [Varicellaria rhodocarpa]
MHFSTAFVAVALPFLVITATHMNGPSGANQVHPPITHKGIEYKQAAPIHAPPHLPPLGPNPHPASGVYLSQGQHKKQQGEVGTEAQVYMVGLEAPRLTPTVLKRFTTVHVPASLDHAGHVLPVQDQLIPATGTNTGKPHKAGPHIGKRELLARNAG